MFSHVPSKAQPGDASPPDNIVLSRGACFAYSLNKADPATHVLSCGESTQGLVFDWLLRYTLDATGLSDTEQGNWTDLRNEIVAEMYIFLEMHSYLWETLFSEDMKPLIKVKTRRKTSTCFSFLLDKLSKPLICRS